MAPRNGTPIERVLRRVVHEDRGHSTPCWIWMGALDPRGYGRVGARRADGSHSVAFTHRVTFEHFKGPLADDHEPDHLCRTRACCNPDHLEGVTRAENMRRVFATHCSHGHEYTEANTRYRTNAKGYTCRDCRACGREKTRARRAAQ